MTDIDRAQILVLEGPAGTASRAIRRAGGLAMTVSPTDADAVFAAFDNGYADALLLTGGGDVDPRRYSKKVHASVYGVDENRDMVEDVALWEARKQGLPVLGICRGSQIMNVEAGGTLYQNIPDQLHHRKHASGAKHIVKTSPGSLLHDAIGESAFVISLHHQAVARVGKGFHVVAKAVDGTPEAIESDDGRCLGVQFHPELAPISDTRMQRLFALFVERACVAAGIDYLPKAWQPVPKPAKKVKAKLLKTAQQTLALASVQTTWRCFRCNIDFDLRSDHLDHMAILHGVDLAEAEA